MEDNVTKRNTEKCKKYSVIQESLIGKWEVHVLVLEVGSRGWIPDSFVDALRQLGFSSSEINQLADQ
jgi:lysine/ornithine N-monooxygenase